LLNVLEERYLSKLERIMRDVSDDIDIVQFGDDLGTQNGPWMDPELIRNLFVPHYKKLWDYVHSHSNCKVFMHNCGSISSLLGYLIDAGLDIINPVQTTASNMDPVMLKREFGQDVTFWGGGCEVQGVLTAGSPEDVIDQVRRRIEIFGKNGGFVFNQVHNILANVPVDNILAMYRAAYEYGSY
jgi:uroporphyrinogen decarboxylase